MASGLEPGRQKGAFSAKILVNLGGNFDGVLGVGPKDENRCFTSAGAQFSRSGEVEKAMIVGMIFLRWKKSALG